LLGERGNWKAAIRRQEMGDGRRGERDEEEERLKAVGYKRR